jgi:hypothetical protein
MGWPSGWRVDETEFVSGAACAAAPVRDGATIPAQWSDLLSFWWR